MQKNVTSKYFSICVSMIIVCLSILGIALMIFASQYYKEEQYRVFESSLNKINSHSQSADLEEYSNIMSDAIDADIFITDTSGRTLFCTEEYPCKHTTYLMSANILENIAKNGIYNEQGLLDGIYSENFYTTAIPLTDNSQNITGYIFASTEASSSLQGFLMELVQMFLIATVLVLVVSMIMIFFMSRQFAKPLKEMSYAAKRFGEGDFSAKIEVTSYDEIGQLAMALNSMGESLSTLETMRRSFIANVSHELKTPMQTIGGFIDGILDGTIPQNQQRQYLRTVSDEVKRLARLVRSMLNLAQIEAGEMELHCSNFDMVDTVCQSLFSLEKQIEDKHLDIRGLDHDKVFVNADADLIPQVIYNLTENAIKFSNEGGYIEFGFKKDGNRTLISVKNSGAGLSKEEVPRVFDRFYKTDRSRGIDKNGVGLGLYIVRSIVSLHSGEVIVTSTQGEYCEFTFSLLSGKQPGKPQSKFKKN